MKKCTYTCDRCGKDATIAEYCPQGHLNYWGVNGGRKLDLCYECVEELKKFLDFKPRKQS